MMEVQSFCRDRSYANKNPKAARNRSISYKEQQNTGKLGSSS